MPEDLSDIFQTRSMPSEKAIAKHFGIFGDDPNVRQGEDWIQIRRSSHERGRNRKAGTLDLPGLIC
jgi:hypothetical protein